MHVAQDKPGCTIKTTTHSVTHPHSCSVESLGANIAAAAAFPTYAV